MLVVDDEELIRRIVREILTSEGFAVIEAGDGQEALDVYRSRRREIGVVILDLSMPRLSGEEALVALYQLDPEVRVLVLSGRASTLSDDQMHRMGVRAFVRKPFRNDELVRLVREAVDS